MFALVSLPEQLAGVPTTAIGVALIRANETARSDRLIDDPYAQVFVDAAANEFLGSSSPPDAAQTWATLHQLAKLMTARAVSVRFLEDYLLDAAQNGCEQVVLLGAGLDTYAFRLPWPPGVRLFEIDLPEMFAFKEEVLASHAAEPRCERTVVPADLCSDWAAALVAAGLDTAAPTAWLEAGVVDYLPREDARRVMSTVSAASALGSRFACIRPGTLSEQTQQGLVRVVAGSDASPARDLTSGFGSDLDEWLSSRSWHTTFRSHADVADSYGREVGMSRSGAGYLTATLTPRVVT